MRPGRHTINRGSHFDIWSTHRVRTHFYDIFRLTAILYSLHHPLRARSSYSFPSARRASTWTTDVKLRDHISKWCNCVPTALNSTSAWNTPSTVDTTRVRDILTVYKNQLQRRLCAFECVHVLNSNAPNCQLLFRSHASATRKIWRKKLNKIKYHIKVNYALSIQTNWLQTRTARWDFKLQKGTKWHSIGWILS